MAHYLKQYENAMKTYTCGRGLSESLCSIFLFSFMQIYARSLNALYQHKPQLIC